MHTPTVAIIDKQLQAKAPGKIMITHEAYFLIIHKEAESSPDNIQGSK